MYIGTDGVYSYTFKHERREDCPVCGGKSVLFEVGKEWTVNDLIDALAERPDMYVVDLIYCFFPHLSLISRPLNPHPSFLAPCDFFHDFSDSITL